MERRKKDVFYISKVTVHTCPDTNLQRSFSIKEVFIMGGGRGLSQSPAVIGGEAKYLGQVTNPTENSHTEQTTMNVWMRVWTDGRVDIVDQYEGLMRICCGCSLHVQGTTLHQSAGIL